MLVRCHLSIYICSLISYLLCYFVWIWRHTCADFIAVFFILLLFKYMPGKSRIAKIIVKSGAHSILWLSLWTNNWVLILISDVSSWEYTQQCNPIALHLYSTNSPGFTSINTDIWNYEMTQLINTTQISQVGWGTKTML